jgi:hypothetical protein
LGAREFQEQVLVARQQVLGPEHPNTLIAMLGVAVVAHA